MNKCHYEIAVLHDIRHETFDMRMNVRKMHGRDL